MKKELEQQYNISENAEEVNKETSSEKLLTNDPIEDTPFRLIGNNKQGYAIAMGMHRLTEPKQTEKLALEELKTKDNGEINYNLIANMIIAITRTYDDIEREKIKDSQE